MYSYSCASWGTTEDTIAPSTSLSDSPRSPRTPDMTTAIWSPVASRTVANRQCSTKSSPRNMPTWVCVLPTSTAISMARDYLRVGRIDYDQHQYKVFSRARTPLPENRRRWTAIFRNWLGGATTVVDVGAGVGAYSAGVGGGVGGAGVVHYSAVLAEALPDARVIGVEPSDRMRSVALEEYAHERVEYVAGRA